MRLFLSLFPEQELITSNSRSHRSGHHHRSRRRSSHRGNGGGRRGPLFGKERLPRPLPTCSTTGSKPSICGEHFMCIARMTLLWGTHWCIHSLSINMICMFYFDLLSLFTKCTARQIYRIHMKPHNILFFSCIKIRHCLSFSYTKTGCHCGRQTKVVVFPYQMKITCS